MLKRYRPAVIFFATTAAGASVLLSRWMDEGPLLAVSSAITVCAQRTLDAVGFGVQQHGNALLTLDSSFGMRIKNDCNGAWAHLIFLASVLAYPAHWKQKLVGLALGQTALFVLNIFRLVSLFLIGVYVPAIFRATHVYVWQFLIIGLAVALFFIWVDRFVTRPA